MLLLCAGAPVYAETTAVFAPPGKEEEDLDGEEVEGRRRWLRPPTKASRLEDMQAAEAGKEKVETEEDNAHETVTRRREARAVAGDRTVTATTAGDAF